VLSSIPLRVSDSVQKSKVIIRLLTVELDGRAFVELNFTSRLELSKFQRRLIPLSNTACFQGCHISRAKILTVSTTTFCDNKQALYGIFPYFLTTTNPPQNSIITKEKYHRIVTP